MMKYAKRNARLSSLAGVMAAVAISVAISCASTVDAAAVVGDACTRQYDSVDITATGPERIGGTTYNWIIEIRVDSGSWHQINYNGDRTRGFELIAVDGTGYTREMNQQGQWGPWGTQPILGAPSGSSARSDDSASRDAGTRSHEAAPSTFCGLWEFSAVEYVGTATIGADNTSVRHFKVSFDHPEVGGGDGSYENYEYWIDDSGKLLQTRVESLDADGDHYINTLVTLSGHGEPNVITAPVIPE